MTTPAVPGGRSGLFPTLRRSVLRPLSILAASLAAWWLVVWILAIPAYLLPAPDVVAATILFLAREGDLARHVWATVLEIVIGFSLGSVCGVAAGWLFNRAPRLGRLVSPVILLLQTTPKIAIAPLLLLWLGLGLGPKVALIAIVSFFPVLTATVAGLGAIDGAYRDLARLLRLGSFARFWRIDLPFAMPTIFAGLRIATTQAVTAAVVGELIGTAHGLGYLLSVGQENSSAAVVLAAVAMLSTLGWSLHELVRAAENRLVSWQR